MYATAPWVQSASWTPHIHLAAYTAHAATTTHVPTRLAVVFGPTTRPATHGRRIQATHVCTELAPVIIGLIISHPKRSAAAVIQQLLVVVVVLLISLLPPTSKLLL